MKKLFTVLLSIFLLCTVSFGVSANDLKVIDEADVLSDEEEKEITSLANDYIAKTNYDIVIYFAYDKAMTIEEAEALADDTFDYNCYGIGEDYDGIIMVVDVYHRVVSITTCGASCIDTYTDYSIDQLYDYVCEYLGYDDWYGACEAFVAGSEYIYDDNNGNNDYYQYEDNNDNNEHYQYEDNNVSNQVVLSRTNVDYAEEALVPALIIGAAVTLICFIIFYKQLKNTGENTNASHYLTGSNLNIFRSGEIYLYTNTSRRKIEQQSSSSGGHSSTHISSSGRSHGGGGGRHF